MLIGFIKWIQYDYQDIYYIYLQNILCRRSSDSDSESEPEVPEEKTKKKKKSKGKKKKDKKQVKSLIPSLNDRSLVDGSKKGSAFSTTSADKPHKKRQQGIVEASALCIQSAVRSCDKMMSSLSRHSAAAMSCHQCNQAVVWVVYS